MYIYKKYKRNCEYCNRYYEGSGERFCSGSCRSKKLIKKLNLPKEDVIRLYLENKSAYTIAKIYNCSVSPVYRILKKNNLPFNYVGDGVIWFRGDNGAYNPDFLSKNPKHIIEIFGDYWHNLPNIKEKDIKRLETYSKYGYKTLIIWEHELKNIIEVLNKIRGFIKW